MADMIVNLYTVKKDVELCNGLEGAGIKIVRALAPDKVKILKFIEEHAESNWAEGSRDNWMSECDIAMNMSPPACFLAVKDHKIVGFACYNATAKGFFGPTGVLVEQQKKGIGKALLLEALVAMKEEGFGYAVIGWPADTAISFYEKVVGAEIIKNSEPSVYSRLV